MKVLFSQISKFGNSEVRNCVKRRAPNNDEDPSNEFLKILEIISVSTNNMEWAFGNTDQISLKNIKAFLNLGKQETNSETEKPRNQESLKPINEETNQPRNFSSKGIPNTPQNTDSHQQMAPLPKSGDRRQRA